MAIPRVTIPIPTRPELCYAMDFVHDRLVKHLKRRPLAMTDLCSKEVSVIEVDVSIGGEVSGNGRPTKVRDPV